MQVLYEVCMIDDFKEKYTDMSSEQLNLLK